jgi:hypothetical protein
MADSINNQAPETGTRDWFLAAIEARGSVAQCLGAVLRELETRTQFVEVVQKSLDESGTGADRVTLLGQRIKSLENTLRFRLGILRPERPGAWFRAPAATSTGPFASTLLAEPVFSFYKPMDVDQVRRGLRNSWERRSIQSLPFESGEPCLWRTLIQLAEEFERINKLPAPFESFTLKSLPQGLPPVLESRALRAFLINVSAELQDAEKRLTNCHGDLMQASEKLWDYQKEQSKYTFRRERERDRSGPADDVRAEFKRRRQSARPLRSFRDSEALRFMGFDDLPSFELLKSRYINLAKQFHPDRHGGDEAKFKLLTKAYSHLNSRIER